MKNERVPIIAASVSRYEGMDVLMGKDEMLRRGCFSMNDYAEFANLQKGILSDLVLIKQLMFGDVSFKPPETSSMRRKKDAPKKSRGRNQSTER